MGWETPQVTTASWAAADATKTKSSEPDWNAGVGAAQDSPASWTQQNRSAHEFDDLDRFNSGTEISDAVPNGYKDEQDAWGPENGRDEGQRDFSDMQCYNCQGMGHGSRNCPEPQKERELRPFLDWSRHPEMTSGEAWAKLKIADAEKDLDDIKEYFEIYAKNTLGATFQSIEKQFREKNMNTRLVCLKKAIPLNKTNVSLQQVPDQQYAVGFQLTKKSRRTKMIDGMLADTYEDNFERLSDCGFTVASRVPVCYNCNQKGHIGKDCPEGRPDPKDRDMSHIVKVVCSNCEEEGHRLRICPVPRKFRSRGCRNCGDESHMVADCDQPKRPREGESCFNCGSAEHHGKDCTEERKPREDTRECYNCMKTGHIGRECPDPRKSRENRGQAPDPFAEAEPMNFTSPAAHETAPAWSTSSELCGWQPTEAPTPVSVGCW